MTGDEEAANDGELRSLLEKIAATAGDPPEHGLARVADMRRRRKRHRRGAVATAMALTVTGIGGTAWLSSQREGEDDLAVAAQGDDQRESTAALPDVLEVECSPDGIVVPVASIRPQPDGLHLEVVNGSQRRAELRVTSQLMGWDSGPVPIEPGTNELRQPLPPGVLTVGCMVDEVEELRRAELVDEEQLYEEPSLSCPEEQRQADPLGEQEVDPPAAGYTVAVRKALDGVIEDTDDVMPLDGYPEQEFGDPTVDPMVRVVRDGHTVAFVALLPADVEGPWSSAALTEACQDFLPDPEKEEEGAPEEAALEDSDSGPSRAA